MSTAFPCFFLVASEPSGDALGAKLMQALKMRLGGQVRFAGIGGERMQAEGLVSLFPQSELALFGLFEVLPKIPHVLRRLAETEDMVRQTRPAAVVTIDGPGFSFRLAKRLQKTGIPLIHYVAPTVWAWRPERAKKIAKLYRHLMVLLPFEPPYFEKEGLATTFVGHSVIEQGAGQGEGARFRTMAGLPAQQKIITVLPGSRRSEISRLAPVFGETLRSLLPLSEGFSVVVPTVPQVAEVLAPHLKKWPVRPIVVIDEQQKYDAFAASHVALAASGTVGLELAIAGLPHVIAYRLNALTAAMAKLLLKVKFVNLVNILLNRPVVPELLQQDCVPDKLVRALLDLWTDETARNAQKAGFAEAISMLGGGGGPLPSQRAAEIVCRVAGVEGGAA